MRGRHERGEGERGGMSARNQLISSLSPSEGRGRRRARGRSEIKKRGGEKEGEDEARGRQEVENCSEDEWSRSKKEGVRLK